VNAGEGTSAAEEARVLMGLAVDVYCEYARDLWHTAGPSGQPTVRSSACPDATLALGEDGAEGPQEQEFWQDCGKAQGRSIEEWHVHRYGSVTVFVFDTKGRRLSSAGAGKGKIQSFISTAQQDALSSVMADEATQVLILASDTPFLLESEVPEGETPKSPASPNSGGRSSIFFEWRSYPDELNEILEMVFEWKGAQYPAREAVLLAAGPGFGTTGDVVDRKLGISIPTVMTGPIYGRVCSPARRWLMKAELAGGRFSYAYRQPVEECNFCALDIDLGSGQNRPTVDVQLVRVPVPQGTDRRSGVSAPVAGGAMLALTR